MVEITRMFTLSTSHIEADTTKFIENNDVASYTSEYGYIISLAGIDIQDFPESLKNCIELAKYNNCDWLNFDRDGDIMHELKTFDW